MPEKSVFTPQNFGVSILGGVAAAVIFAVVSRGGLGALMMALVAPLPIMIVAMGFGVVHGATTALLATVILSFWPHPVIGMIYAMLVALPAWTAAYAASGAPRSRRDVIQSNHAAWGVLAPAAIVATAVVAWIIVSTINFGSFDAALSEIQARVFLALEELAKRQDIQGKFDAKELSGHIARAIPAAVASYAVLIHAANLWLGARIAQGSQLLTRPWPDIANELRFPRIVGGVFASGMALSFFDGPSGAIGLVLTSVTGLLMAFQGLAVIHVYLRGSKSSVLTLSIIYFVLGLLGWPLVIFTLLGLADLVFNYRGRFAAAAAAKSGLNRTDQNRLDLDKSDHDKPDQDKADQKTD